MFRTVIRWHRIFQSSVEAQGRIPPGKLLLLHLAGRKICVVNTAPVGSETPVLAAIEERCPHNGFSLARGWCSADGTAVVCPLHRYAFDLKTGRSQNGGGGAARVFPVEIRDDGVFLGTEEMEWGFGRRSEKKS